MISSSTNYSSKQRSPLHVAGEIRPSQQPNQPTHWMWSFVDTRLQQMAKHRLLHHKILRPDVNDALQHRFARPTPEGHPPAASPNKMPRNHQAFSLRNRRTLIARPFGAEYPPSAPFAATTRWQGTTSGKRFVAITLPTARAARGEPACRASSP